MVDVSERTYMMRFEIKRERPSVTQGFVKVFCNGEQVATFGDEIALIQPGEKYYGELIGGWASKTPDLQFVRATLFHKYDDVYNVSDGVQKMLNAAIDDEILYAPVKAPNEYNGKKVFEAREWGYKERAIGDLVTEEFVMDMLDMLPPVCMRSDCSQCGEPYSHRQDPDDGKWKPTFSTFKAVAGERPHRIFEYCGNCFAGENVERGKDPVYVAVIK